MRRIRINRTILIVEGKDDAGVCQALYHWMGVEPVQIVTIGGASNFKDVLEQPGDVEMHAIGLIRDADDSRASAFKSLQRSLKNAGITPPTEPGVFTETVPHVGALIMPPEDTGTGRALEDVLFASVQTEVVDAMVDRYIAFFEEQGLEMRELDLTKARIHAFLNAQDVPGLTISEAAKRGIWNFGHEAFAVLRNFLTHLAELR